MLFYGISFIDLPEVIIYIGITYAFLGSVYGSFKLPLSRRYAKDLLSAKTIGTVFIITSFLIILPFNLDNEPNKNRYCLLLYFIGVHVLCNTVMGDLRDIQVDKANRVETFVTKFGFEKTKYLLILILLCSVVFFIMTKQYVFIATFIAVIISLLIIKPNSKIITYHYIDCVHFIPLLSFLIISIQ